MSGLSLWSERGGLRGWVVRSVREMVSARACGRAGGCLGKWPLGGRRLRTVFAGWPRCCAPPCEAEGIGGSVRRCVMGLRGWLASVANGLELRRTGSARSLRHPLPGRLRRARGALRLVVGRGGRHGGFTDEAGRARADAGRLGPQSGLRGVGRPLGGICAKPLSTCAFLSIPPARLVRFTQRARQGPSQAREQELGSTHLGPRGHLRWCRAHVSTRV